MKSYEVIATKRTNKGSLMASLFSDVNHLVINAFIRGDETKIEVGKFVAGELFFSDKYATFIIM